MSETSQSHPLSRFLVIAASIVFIVWGVSQAEAVLVPLLVSAFFAVLATPPVFWLERRRVPVVVAVLVVVVGMVVVLVGIGAAVGTSINDFYATLPQYQARIQADVAAFRAFLATKHIATPDAILLKYMNPEAVMNMTAGLFMRLGSAFSHIVLIVLTVTFILLEATSFPGKLRAVLGDPYQRFPQFTTFIDDVKRYVVIKTIISLATGVLVMVWLSILHVDFPILWGFLAFLLNYVPSIGAFVAAVPAVLLAVIQLGLGMGLLVAGGYGVINLSLAYGIETRLMGRKLGLSALVVFLSLIFWGSLLGPIGAVLCIPLTMSLKFALESHESTRWVAVLLGPGRLPPGPPPSLREMSAKTEPF